MSVGWFIVINAAATHNHHGETTWNSPSLRLSMCLFVTTPPAMTKFSRNSNFSPTLLPSCFTLNQCTLKVPPTPIQSNKHNGCLSSQAARLPPKQLAPGSALSGLERMTPFPFFPSFRFSSAHGHSALSCVEINKPNHQSHTTERGVGGCRSNLGRKW